MTTAPPQTTTRRRRADAHPAYNWEVRAHALEKQAANDANTITELKRQLAELNAQLIQPGTVSLFIAGQPVVHVLDYVAAPFLENYNSGREQFPESPRYKDFQAYMNECLKDYQWGLNGLGIHERGE